MTKTVTTVLVLTIAILALNNAAPTQEYCREAGPGCRLLTSAELEAIKQRLLALKAALKDKKFVFLLRWLDERSSANSASSHRWEG